MRRCDRGLQQLRPCRSNQLAQKIVRLQNCSRLRFSTPGQDTISCRPGLLLSTALSLTLRSRV